METVTGEEYRENDEGAHTEEEGEVMVSEEEDGDEKEAEGGKEEDGAQSDHGDDLEFENGRGVQRENSSPSRPSTSCSQLSRSPPRSRSPSPDTLAKMTAALTLRTVDVRERVSADLAKRQRQQKKYHTKRSAQRVGRPQGSKAKQDQRVKLDRGGIWD